jgi:hypothetical protein
MLPNEHKPLVLTASQQQMRDRYTAMGFRISERPFASAGEQLYFFASRTGDADPKQNYSINLHNGSLKVMGEDSILVLSQAQQRFGQTSGERLSVSSPCESVPAEPPLPPPAESQPAPPHGGLTPSRSPSLDATTPPLYEPTVVPPPANAETVKPDAASPPVPIGRERPAAVAESGKATAVASPVKPVKKKQTALF